MRIADHPAPPAPGTQAGSAESLHLLGDASRTHFTGAACRVSGTDCPVWRPQPHGAWKRGSLALRVFFCFLVFSLICKFNGLGTEFGWDAKGNMALVHISHRRGSCTFCSTETHVPSF